MGQSTLSAAYIGMTGSRRKVPAVFQHLNEKGPHPESDPRVYVPIGPDLGGKTLAETAVAVVAEIPQVMSRRSGGHCREIQGQDRLASRRRGTSTQRASQQPSAGIQGPTPLPRAKAGEHR